MYSFGAFFLRVKNWIAVAVARIVKPIQITISINFIV